MKSKLQLVAFAVLLLMTSVAKCQTAAAQVAEEGQGVFGETVKMETGGWSPIHKVINPETGFVIGEKADRMCQYAEDVILAGRSAMFIPIGATSFPCGDGTKVPAGVQAANLKNVGTPITYRIGIPIDSLHTYAVDICKGLEPPMQCVTETGWAGTQVFGLIWSEVDFSQRLRQEFADASTSAMHQQGGLGHAEAVGTTLIIHSERCSQEQFNKLFVSNDKLQEAVRALGFKSFVYTNDTNLKFVLELSK